MATELTSANGTFRATLNADSYEIVHLGNVIGVYGCSMNVYFQSNYFFAPETMRELADFIETIKQEANGTK